MKNTPVVDLKYDLQFLSTEYYSFQYRDVGQERFYTVVRRASEMDEDEKDMIRELYKAELRVFIENCNKLN